MINGKNFNIELLRPKVLISPLDWGLGHATRCIPIINELIECHCEVVIAADGDILFLLKKEFPTIVFLQKRGYKIKYSRKGKWLPLKLLRQLPGLIVSIWREKLWIKKIIKEQKINAIISDNRFGLHSRKVPCVYITHQLHIKTGNPFFEKLVQKLHYYFIKKYTYCWVPDFKQNGLAGELSQPVNIPSNVLYIGPLSRFEKKDDVPEKYALLISLSGPEPQRTIFEKILLIQLQTFDKKTLLVRGLPGENEKLQNDMKSTDIVNHLSADELNLAIQQSKIIISRSGYSTIMDLIKLGKSGILVPTPGQTEQEYLADYLMEKKYFYSVRQDNFILEEAIAGAFLFPCTIRPFAGNSYKKVINEFVGSLKSGNFASQ